MRSILAGLFGVVESNYRSDRLKVVDKVALMKLQDEQGASYNVFVKCSCTPWISVYLYVIQGVGSSLKDEQDASYNLLVKC